jgi:hypothetical protein
VVQVAEELLVLMEGLMELLILEVEVEVIVEQVDLVL